MICYICGNEIPNISKFCRFCGAAQEELVAVKTTAQPITQLTENTHTTVESSRTARIPEGTNVTTSPRYGGFLIRLAAYILDYGLLLIVFIGIGLIIGSDAYEKVIANNSTIFGYLGFVVYNIFFLSTWSTTPGKALYGLRVAYKVNGQKVSFGTALGRSILQIISTFLFGVGYWNMGSDKYKQAFHDVQTKTVVLREEVNLALPLILTAVAGAVFVCFSASGSQ